MRDDAHSIATLLMVVAPIVFLGLAGITVVWTINLLFTP